jgi:NAD(P)-dependent dehydrogenase (short-subunit alcohol dehydrogenase family)
MTDNLFSVQDKVIIVTGGLGQLGRQYALTLAARGAKVVVLDVRSDEAAVNARYPERPPNMAFFSADVTNRDSLEAALKQVNALWGIPHVLINNAALDSPPNAPAEENGPFETYPKESWDKILDVNLTGVFLCCQVIGGQMAEAGRGSIINICSIYGMVSPVQGLYTYRAERDGKPFFKPVAYSASKSGLTNLTRYLATYWAGKGVRVNTLTLAGVFNHQDAQFLEQYQARMPLGRMAREDEYNGAIVFLASEASSYMTGSNMVIDGGWTAW